MASLLGSGLQGLASEVKCTDMVFDCIGSCSYGMRVLELRRSSHHCLSKHHPAQRKSCGTVCAQVNYFHFVAEEVRAGLAALGLRSLDELIGRADLLRQRPDLVLAKTSGLDLSYISGFAGETGASSVRSNQEVRFFSSLVLPSGRSACYSFPCIEAVNQVVEARQSWPRLSCIICLVALHGI